MRVSDNPSRMIRNTSMKMEVCTKLKKMAKIMDKLSEETQSFDYKEDLLNDEGIFISQFLEDNYQKYVARKNRQNKKDGKNKPIRDRLDWKEARDYWLNDSPMARGNAFNKKAGRKYPYNEIYLSNGKRLDSYNPRKGEIVSRKATDLDMIELETFEKYLKEMDKKYSVGTVIRSNKYKRIDGEKLQGRHILEIPKTNESLDNIQEYKDIANKYNIELRFTEE